MSTSVYARTPHLQKGFKVQALTLSLVLGTGVLLGVGNPLARAASSDGIHPLVFTLWPTVAAGLVLSLIGWVAYGTRSVDLRLVGFGLVAGAFGHALPMLAAYWLAAHAGAGFASLSFTLTPVLTLTIMAMLGRELLQPVRIAAVALGMAGGLLLVGGQVWSLQLDTLFIAIALLVPSLIAATNVYRGIYMPRGTPDTWLSASTLVGSTVLLGMLVPLLNGKADLLPGVRGAGWLAVQAVVLVMGYLCYFALQRRAEPVAFSLIGYVMMLVSVGLGTAVFGEAVSWTLWPAVVLIGIALWLIHRFPARGLS